jgi:hypothetical protein
MSTWTLFSLMPLLFLILSLGGLVMLTLGVRGQPVFALPRCAKCSYDLRGLLATAPEHLGACPECGSPLDPLGAVSFGRWRRNPRQIVWGVILMGLPWSLLPLAFRSRAIATGSVIVSPANRASLPTPALLASLKTSVNTPWDWQELQRRLSNGTLTQADASAAVNILIADLNAQRAAGRPPQPLSWAGPFLKAAISGGLLPSTQIKALCQAYYGLTPELNLRPRAHQGEPLVVDGRLYEPWTLEGMQLCWSLGSVIVDGTTKLTPQLRYGSRGAAENADQFSGTGTNGQLDLKLPQSLPPGEHEIAFTFDVGTVSDRAIFHGMDGKPGTADKWPSAIATWRTVATRKVIVVGKDQPVIDLVTDPASDPANGFTLSVSDAVMRPSSHGRGDLLLRWKATGIPAMPICAHVVVLAGDRRIDYGQYMFIRQSGGTSSSYNDSVSLRQPIPPDVKQVDVVLEPDPKAAQAYPKIERIWGKPIRISNVPLQRFDLAGTAAPATQASGDGRP